MTHPLPANRRILIASLTGTAIEFYDFYIYATAAALVFGGLFFPSGDPVAQRMAAYLSFGLAFIARPLGATIFGHFGDRAGRKSTLVASLLLMGGSTVLIGLLPTYASAGVWAPVLLCLLRFGQGLGLGGEWGGASLLAVENAPVGWTNRFGMFPPLGAPVGFLAANGLFLVLSAVLTDDDFAAWGWRLPFLASALLVALGLWIRLRLTETPAFVAARKANALPRVPIARLLEQHLRPTLAGIFAVVAAFALFYLSTAFALGYGTGTLGYTRQQFLGVELGAIGFLALGVILSCILADRIGGAAALAMGFVGCLGAGLLMGVMLGSGSLLLIWAWLSAALFAMGFAYGPTGAWLPRLFPAEVRYTGVSITFNVASILGGAMAPIAAEWLAARGGLALVGSYLVVAGVLSLIGLLMVSRGASRLD